MSKIVVGLVNLVEDLGNLLIGFKNLTGVQEYLVYRKLLAEYQKGIFEKYKN